MYNSLLKEQQVVADGNFSQQPSTSSSSVDSVVVVGINNNNNNNNPSAGLSADGGISGGGRRQLSGIECIGTAGVLIDAFDNNNGGGGGREGGGRASSLLIDNNTNLSNFPLFHETLCNILANNVIDLPTVVGIGNRQQQQPTNNNDQQLNEAEIIRNFLAAQQQAHYLQSLLTLSSMNYFSALPTNFHGQLPPTYPVTQNYQQQLNSDSYLSPSSHSASTMMAANSSTNLLTSSDFSPFSASSTAAAAAEEVTVTTNSSKFTTNAEILHVLPTPTPSTDVASESDELKIYENDEYQVFEEFTDDDELTEATNSGNDNFCIIDMNKTSNTVSGRNHGRSVIESTKKRYRILELVQKSCQRKKLAAQRKFLANAYNRKRKSGYKEMVFHDPIPQPSRSDSDSLENSNLIVYKIQKETTNSLPYKNRFRNDLICERLVKWPKLRENEYIVKVFKKSILKKKKLYGQVQQHTCHELKDVPKCLDCAESKSIGSDNVYCRFMDFRRLSYCDGVLRQVGFAVYDNLSVRNQHSEFLPSSSSSKSWSIDTACYVLSNVYGQFRCLLEREEKFLNDCLRWNFIGSAKEAIPWRDPFNVRELCDVCATTIFNLHMICKNCGFAVCIDCVYSRIRRQTRCETPGANQDNFGWLFCPSKRYRLHGPSILLLAKLIPDINLSILSTLHSLNDRLTVQMKKYALNVPISNQTNSFETMNVESYTIPSGANISPSSSKSLPPHYYMHDGAILIFKESKCSSNLALFKSHWQLALPVLVENTTNTLNPELWSPVVFKEKSIELASTGSIVDCRTGTVIDDLEIVKFWEGFSDCHKRVKGKDDRKFCLKLKDWPPAEKFSNALPEHFEDFCRSLPIPEYTHPRNGEFNLATNLSSICVEPDLGPKMYTAYEMTFEPNKGTTNLHLDVSCAVNILVSVTTPVNINQEYLYAAILAHLNCQDLDPVDLERATLNPSKIGALWTIFRPEDSDAIRDFLIQLAEERRQMDTDDPIHDQLCYLHAHLRQRLFRDRGVKGFTFVQMLGDAVFIPAGAAHQVQNLLCCIKVAEDFVSPEGVCRCAAVAGEFRNLTKQHSNHEDKLQLSNIVLHSVRETVRTLELN